MSDYPSISQKLKARIGKTLARMRRTARAGSASIEFALIVPVFFILLMGIIENGIIYFAGSTLQAATENAARLIRTGQAQTSSPAMTQAQFRTTICNGISVLLTCNTNLQIDVESYPAGYSAATYGSPTNASGGLNTALSNWSPGNACDVVLVRTFYTWKVLTPVLSQFLTNITGGYHLVTATAAFRNEPYVNNVVGC